MQIAVLADIGQPVYHVGDEAIGRATTHEIQSRGHQVKLLTRNIVATLREHCANIDAAWTVPFPINPAQREYALKWACELAERFVNHPEITAAEIPYEQSEILALVREIQDVDAVLLGGGGNFNSKYGWLFFERLLVGKIAQLLGKPVAVSGQTLGPQLTKIDHQIAEPVLNGLDFFGVRDQGSLELAQTEFPDSPVGLGIDDASFWTDIALGMQNQSGHKKISATQYNIVSLSPTTYTENTETEVKMWARLIDTAHRITGLPTIFIPHMGVPNTDTGDEHFHRLVAEQMTTPALTLPVEECAVSAKRIAESGQIVISNRFHPLVFALSQSLPTLGIHDCAYTAQRLAGLYENWGLNDWAIPLSYLDSDRPAKLLQNIWEEKEKISAHLKQRKQQLTEFHQKWWDTLLERLSNRGQKIAQMPEMPPTTPSEIKILPQGDLPPENNHGKYDQSKENSELENDYTRAKSESQINHHDPFGLIGRCDEFADARYCYDHIHATWMPQRPTC